VAVVDGVVAAFSVAQTDGRSRYWSGMTGTRSAYRNRGLAKLVKNQSLHRARAAGYTEAFTGNDAGNGPMLAINKWFGYQPCASEWRYLRDLNG
jgi:GNAT superfamily N-acetyltransferase